MNRRKKVMQIFLNRFSNEISRKINFLLMEFISLNFEKYFFNLKVVKLTFICLYKFNCEKN